MISDQIRLFLADFLILERPEGLNLKDSCFRSIRVPTSSGRVCPTHLWSKVMRDVKDNLVSHKVSNLRQWVSGESKVDKPAGKDWFGTIYKGRHDLAYLD